MSLPVWCAELAAAFWRKAGPPPPTPRDLTYPALFFGLNVEDLRDLSVARVAGWFRNRDIPLRLNEPDRRLRGCLVASRGVGFAFLDPADDPAERRFTLAHEIAHYLRDYWQPRAVAVRRLGPDATAVLDGDRLPTTDERLRAVLRSVPVGPFTHLLARDADAPATDAEREAEVAADRLAFELLAPAAAVGDAPCASRLVTHFGLPAGPADRYAELLLPPAEPEDRAWSRLLRRVRRS